MERGQEVRAVDGVSVQVKPGEVVVIIGPSGSGKSTFLRCINGLETFDSGHILIDDVDLADRKTDINKVRREVGMVFQQFNLFPHKTVLNNITLAQKVVRSRKTSDAQDKARALLKTSSRELRLPGPWPWIPRSCSSTSRPAPSTPRWSERCST